MLASADVTSGCLSWAREAKGAVCDPPAASQSERVKECQVSFYFRPRCGLTSRAPLNLRHGPGGVGSKSARRERLGADGLA